MSELDGDWKVEPLPGVTKRIQGDRGVTRVGPLPAAPFRVRGLELVYPGGFLVDRCIPDGDGFRLEATFRGRVWGRFRLRRLS